MLIIYITIILLLLITKIYLILVSQMEKSINEHNSTPTSSPKQFELSKGYWLLAFKIIIIF